MVNARLPDPSLYLDPARFVLQLRHFEAAWHGIAPQDIPLAPNTVSPLSILGEPLVLSRDSNSELHLLSNVCTHRGAMMVVSRCQSATIKCPYHGRRFTLDGKVTHAPGFAAHEENDWRSQSLPRVALHAWGAMWFANLAPDKSFSAWIEPVEELLGHLAFGNFVHDPSRDRTFQVPAHWALYCENYLEGLHIPFVHPELAQEVEFGSYRVEALANGVLQTAFATREEVPVFKLPEGHRDAGKRVAAYYFWLYPNVMLNFYPWGLSLNEVIPKSLHATDVVFRSFVQDPALLDQGAGGALDLVEEQDEAILTRVQAGVRARLYRPGSYAHEHELGVKTFHSLLERNGVLST